MTHGTAHTADTVRDRRRLAWRWISDLFVDTSHDEGDLAAIARSLKATGFSESEFHDMFYREVDPVLGGHWCVAVGTWPAFDLDWLENEIGKRRRRSWFGRALGRLHRVNRYNDQDWHKAMAHWRAL